MADQTIFGIIHLLYIKIRFLLIEVIKKIFFIRKLKKIFTKKKNING